MWSTPLLSVAVPPRLTVPPGVPATEALVMGVLIVTVGAVVSSAKM